MYLLFKVFLAAFAVSVAYVFLVWIPLGLYTDAMCMRDGFAMSKVTANLDRYCLSSTGWVRQK